MIRESSDTKCGVMDTYGGHGGMSPPPLPRRQQVRNIYAEPFAHHTDQRLTTQHGNQVSQQIVVGGGGGTLQSNSTTTSACHQLGGGGTVGSNGGTSPLVMPVFPLRPAHSGQHNPSTSHHHYSPYSPSRFHINKRCQHKCTWKCFSIAMILVALILTAMLAYFAVVNSVKPSIDPTNCVLVQDVKAVTHDQMVSDNTLSTPLPTEDVFLATSTTSDHHYSASSISVTNNHQLNIQPQQQTQPWPPVTELREFGQYLRTTIPAYAFWTSEFRNKQPAFITLNFTLPWGANFAVYGRRNVAPSVTQYDFVEFIRGGRVDHRLRRRRRSVDMDAMNSENSLIEKAFKEFLAKNRNVYHHGKGIEVLEKIRNTYGATQQILADSMEKNGMPEVHNISKRASGFGDLNRADTMMVNVSLLQYLDTGRWFLSVYNDEMQENSIELVVSEAEGVSTSCPNDCSGRGSCYLGKCDCIDGFQGSDCSISICPILCSGHGKYGGGVCHCEEGWKGAECDIPATDCEVRDCSGHGSCKNGNCHCRTGWTGPACNEVDCHDPTCSNHGTCVQGKCYCKAGWVGSGCQEVDQRVHACLPGCSDHGAYDLETAKCVCDKKWTGVDCSEPVCDLACGLHGRCELGRCKCENGWTGSRCELKTCDSRCKEHGQCKNGTCVCSQGWNGRHCTLPGCENGCSRNGHCTLEDGNYRCVCINGWAGTDCSIPLETDCNDDIDNDHDGMTDCSDSECCSHQACAEHIMCLASNDPVDVLLRKQPPSVTASFYQRVKFLIEENSVQSYAHMDEYTERRVAVMRGQVLSSQGLGIVGIRVSVDRDSRFGFTLTRQGGWFDVLVNGGGAVTLQFQRSPFRPLTKTVFVPWNQIVVLPPVYMELSDEIIENIPRNSSTPKNFNRVSYPSLSHSHFAESSIPPPACLEHDLAQLAPYITSTWQAESIGGMPGRSLIFAETQIVQESISIPGSNLNLMYQSSQATGYLSTILMRLTGAVIPTSLTHVHVKVELEGSLHLKTYEADPNLTHVFAWNKRNIYKQKVYGTAVAKVSIGYEHSTCKNIIWDTQTATLQGFDVDISDIGGWSLDIHHHYNFHEGIVQKGDGTTLHLKQYPRAVRVEMGTGLRRQLQCPGQCGGAAKDALLLAPVAVTSGPDSSLYVGDFNLIRRITPEGNVYTVLELTATQVAYQYYLCISPADGHLYVSDPERHQILRVLSLDPVGEPAINSEPVVGSGERCIPGDEAECGDGGLAVKSRLSQPKGIAISADRTMYIADGTNIRAVDPRGIIHTLIGHHGHKNYWSPTPCIGAIPAKQAQLQWPSTVTLSPLDGSLHFIDDRLVMKLTPDMKVKVVAGVPLHCRMNPNSTDEVTLKTENVLGTVLSIAFSPNGDLYIAESDSRRTNVIKLLDTAGRLTHFAGRLSNSNCDCNSTTSQSNTMNPIQTCPCLSTTDETSNAETLLSSNAKFQTISALTVSPDGVLHVADQGSLHVLALKHYLPVHDESGEFHIPFPSTGEVYVFNRYGQHIATKDLASGKSKYLFLYSKNTSFGRLSTVTDSSGNKIQFFRDYSNVVQSIENTEDHKSLLNISGIGFLTKLAEKGRAEIQLDYDTNTGLLLSRSEGGKTYMYQYDWIGRVVGLTLPSGETMSLRSQLNDIGIEVSINEGVSPSQSINPIVDDSQTKLFVKNQNGKHFIYAKDSELTVAESYMNGSMLVKTPWGGSVKSFATARHPLLEAALPIEAEILPVWSHQTCVMGDNLINEMTSKFSLVGDVRNPQQTLKTEILVNNSRVIGVEFDQSTSKETFFDKDGRKVLTVTYDVAGLPQSYTSVKGIFPFNISYDNFKRVEGWKWGLAEEKYSYNRHGLLSEITNDLDGTKMFTYNEHNVLSKITLASQKKFMLDYDDDGGLRHVTLPSGTKHSFSLQPSIGLIRVTYTTPGSSRSYLQHYSYNGELLQTVFPGDGARIVYRYDPSSTNRLTEVVHGDGKSRFIYSLLTGLPSEVLHTERDFDYRWDYQYTNGLLTEERIDFGAKTGLSNAKFTYEYDTNYRLMSIQGRIGGQNLPSYNFAYSDRTGMLTQIGQFKLARQDFNQTSIYDGIAIFSRDTNGRFQETRVTVTIHRMEVFRMEFSHDAQGRISQTRTYTRNVGVNTYTNVKNYTWDCDGQLTGAEAQEPWGFRYDDNGNMLALTYRGNTIPMEYNSMDRIVKFGEGLYRYDTRGLVIQNAREERLHYNAKGLLIRANKKGRFDVRYFYDHMDRLTTRKDNYGNVTQFFYMNQERPREVSQIYSPRDGKLMSLVYDDRGHIIYAQVYRHKYYIATDQCGTPVMIFNQYGEGIREIMRSPYGHIVYDSNPYLYLPIDFCGGLLDQVTSLVHMPNGKVYDPLIGQWMTPLWENVLERVATPTHLHLYRFNGNDPINVRQTLTHPTNHLDWFARLGYNLKNLAPQLFPERLPSGLKLTPNINDANEAFFTPAEVITSQLTRGPLKVGVRSGFLAHLKYSRMTDALALSSPPKSALKVDVLDLIPKKIGAASDAPFGRGIVVSRTGLGQAIVSSVPAANAIYRDVYTSVFNRSKLLPFTFIVHNAQQDAFYFVKEETWRAVEDKGQLKRLQGQVNTTFHEIAKENGSGNNYLDVKIHGSTYVINLRYGTTAEKEKQRLLHHARLSAVRKAWHREREMLRNDFPGSVEWSVNELDELRKVGYVSGYEGEYIHDVMSYPELAEDPFNVKFVRKLTETGKTRKKRNPSHLDTNKLIDCSRGMFSWSDDC